MDGERCDVCGCLHEADNPVVKDGILICLECIGDLEFQEEDDEWAEGEGIEAELD